MFEADERTASMCERLWLACEPLGQGDVLTHEVVRSILGCERHTEHWPHCVGKVRKRLEKERGIATWPEHAVGYRLLTDSETLEFLPYKRAMKALRQYRKVRRSVEALPDASLTEYQRRHRLFVIEQAREAERSIRRDLKEQEAVIRPTPVLPRPIRLQPNGEIS